MEQTFGISHSPDRIRLLYRLVQLFALTIFRTFFGLTIKGRENVPVKGAFILASNHQSWFDPPIVGSSCPREIFFAAKKELFKTPILGPVVKFLNSIPVRRSGSDREALEMIEEVLKHGFGVIIFPEGTRFLDGKLRPAKPGIGLIAVKSGVPIVPVYVRNSAKLRRQFWRRSLQITYGKPFLPPTPKDGVEHKEVIRNFAQVVMEHIALTGGVEPPKQMN